MDTRIYRALPDSISLTGRTVRGTAAVFNSWSEPIDNFIEIINPSALDWKTVKKSDIIANMDHRSDYIMARSRHNNKGNLKLELTNEGLNFEFEAPETVKGDELLSHIKRGEYDACSFCFSIAPNGDRWYNEGGQIKREILKIAAIHDVAVVAYPAYSATKVEARSKEMSELFTNLNLMENEINNIYDKSK
jgi:HK97 family phage prohead protease